MTLGQGAIMMIHIMQKGIELSHTEGPSYEKADPAVEIGKKVDNELALKRIEEVIAILPTHTQEFLQDIIPLIEPSKLAAFAVRLSIYETACDIESIKNSTEKNAMQAHAVMASVRND